MRCGDSCSGWYFASGTTPTISRFWRNGSNPRIRQSHEFLRLLNGKTPQYETVNQAEDSSVGADAQSKDQCDNDGKSEVARELRGRADNEFVVIRVARNSSFPNTGSHNRTDWERIQALIARVSK